MIIKWKCEECGHINKSDTEKRHDMNWCNCCGNTAVDAEEYYTRIIGNVTIYEE